MMALISLDRNVSKREMNLDRLPLVIGSGERVDICLDEPTVAEKHCRIELVDGRLVVRDLDTVHGTHINGVSVTEEVLNPGDELAIGLLTFYVQEWEPAETT
ncbi:MAG: FHA domain-containing protein [Thermoguttaceae bacterium]|jgi:pSer/pThr/pTyr-binding forkhead associated (FHA) protein